MYILLIRHLESVKNLTDSFSTTEGWEPLTDDGKIAGETLAKKVLEFSDLKNVFPKNIYCADSVRGKETANFIANAFKCEVQVLNELNSIQSAFRGMTEKSVNEMDKQYMLKLDIYRKGLFNSYDFSRKERFEQLRDFENRVNETVNKILQTKNEELKIFVMHRSPITVTLINFARRFNNYPKDFFGFVPLDVGFISLIQTDETNDNGEIKFVNISPTLITNYE